eukprot:CAMPEP_0181438210 /NCGR_PEP_ID=MMETSP1110-20121109/21792_1 /TAXON_ID=174948 /ORGANISM="Symbiodinium sp., Strain CCMP421" /LENGTH=94 /DNA_ID=CAMNT_0023561891 /DNA_START=61 /DNA_END=345 /DNA_ORIENTATION=+
MGCQGSKPSAQAPIFEPKATELGTESKASESETQEPLNRSEEPTEEVSQVEVVEEEEDSHAKVNKIEEAPELEDVSSCGFLTVCWSGQPRSGEA